MKTGHREDKGGNEVMGMLLIRQEKLGNNNVSIKN